MTDISIRIHATITSAISSALTSLRRQEGQDLIEYAIFSGVIALALMGVGIFYQGAIQSMATGIGNCIDFAATPCAPF